ncbi:hypothetical protein UFOVP826_18 [uncultured Caudovirales phage]|uniref:Uncharacterized protein n=1 Tax=uncultured Caudovirales phage TaxID=2100421 RepID=A0A6J5NZ07_9CAUD|nr:hypothetical protein UFOVP826_18 [uncultured Caudovirales phage]
MSKIIYSDFDYGESFDSLACLLDRVSTRETERVRYGYEPNCHKCSVSLANEDGEPEGEYLDFEAYTVDSNDRLSEAWEDETGRGIKGYYQEAYVSGKDAQAIEEFVKKHGVAIDNHI